jgi:hypothetical protein
VSEEIRSNRSIYGKSRIRQKVKPRRWTTMGLGPHGPTNGWPYQGARSPLGRFEGVEFTSNSTYPRSVWGRSLGRTPTPPPPYSVCARGLPARPDHLYKGGAGRGRELQATSPPHPKTKPRSDHCSRPPAAVVELDLGLSDNFFVLCSANPNSTILVHNVNNFLEIVS